MISLKNIPPGDRSYFLSLYREYSRPKPKHFPKIGRNFFPSALLSEKERGNLLGAVEYRHLLKKRSAYERAAQDTSLILNPMSGGIGTSLERRGYLERIWKSLGRKGDPRLGTKGTDLFFEIKLGRKTVPVSISEAKILRAIQTRRNYSRVIYEPLASSETAHALESVVNHVNVYGRCGVFSAWGKKTYREIFDAQPRLANPKIHLQSLFPTVHKKGHLLKTRAAPGGHGYWGKYLLLRSLEDFALPRRENWIGAIYNEDGINNGVDPVIVGWMTRALVPMAMLSTTKTGLDKKGGLIGITRLGRNLVRKEIFEEAQAESANQTELFHEMGLSRGRTGKQFFNTNTALLNYGVLVPFLRELTGIIGEKTLDAVLTPRLIVNRKIETIHGKELEFVQLEGALGSVLMNLDAYLMTSRDPGVKRLLDSYGYRDGSGRVRFLRIVNVDPAFRIRFFTPIKNISDFHLLARSGQYRLNPRTWELQTL